MEQYNIEETAQFRFALVTDSKLCDEVDTVCEEISREDEKEPFDCIIHLGNVVLGNNPEKITRRLYAQEVEKFKDCTQSGKLFLTQGKSDGYRDETFTGQLAMNIVTDEKWAAQTGFIGEYDNVVRQGNQPYYYADFPEKKVRLIFLCAYFSQFDQEDGLYEKYTSIDVAQNKWLRQVIATTESGWTLLFFSHGIPKSRFEQGKDPFIYNGYSTEPTLRIMQTAWERGVHIAGWFAGAYQRDEVIQVAGINHIVVDSLAPHGKKIAEKSNQEKLTSWDSVLVDTKARASSMKRFGYGEDRVIIW